MIFFFRIRAALPDGEVIKQVEVYCHYLVRTVVIMANSRRFSKAWGAKQQEGRAKLVPIP